MKFIRSLLGVALVAAVTVSTQSAPLGSAFTYQGRLEDGGAPAHGLYDFHFGLADAASGGGYIGTPSSLAAVAVSNGIFTVTIDFGAGAFAGDERWLEIAVRTNGSPGPFTLLAPRQPVTPAPHALY